MSRQAEPAVRVRSANTHPLDGPEDTNAGSPSPDAGHVLAQDHSAADDNAAFFTVITTTALETSAVVTQVPATGLLGLPTPTTIFETETLAATVAISQVISTPSVSTVPPLTTTVDLSGTRPVTITLQKTVTPLPSATASSGTTLSSASSLGTSSVSATTTASGTSSTPSLISSTSLSSSSSEASASSIPSSFSVPTTTSMPATSTKSTSAHTSQSTDSDSVLADKQGGAAKQAGGVPPAAVAIVVIVVLLAAGGLVFLFYRRRQIQNRRARRATWKAGILPHPNDFSSVEKGIMPPATVQPYMIGTPIPEPPRAESPEVSRQNVTRKPPPLYPGTLSPPPATYNNPSSSTLAPLSPMRTTPVSPRTQVPPGSSRGTPTIVRVTFVTTLPDELTIVPGERLLIDSAFDDGWALCTNARGEQGMVPLECLEGGGGQFADVSPPSDWRNSRRQSSLQVNSRASLHSVRP
ncbi:hypothetical protein BV25DRAFT_660586 [Artomyces pyxidatus]|uniref:Uncharacterized protein n=1 Tax=Artomyces pyxidatus TaxID=48021 RepID=A0ACB8T288_9AGAM|nr:hypothetical protein BV25DRAFT_660586 [Artomyces pyxidatus]